MEYPKDYFDINKKILKIAGLWKDSTGSCWLYESFRVFCFVYCVVFCTPSEFVKLLDTWGNMTEFMMNLGIALTHGIASLKVLNWYWRRRQILDMMNILDDEKYYYQRAGEFRPGFVVEKAKRINVSVSKMFFILANIIPGSSYVFGLGKYLFSNESLYDVHENQVVYCRKLPFYSWIPFDHTSGRITCLLGILFQAFPFTYLTVMIVAMDTLYMGLINYLTAHLLVLQGAFKHIRLSAQDNVGNFEKFTDEGPFERQMMTEIKKRIQHLQVVQK